MVFNHKILAPQGTLLWHLTAEGWQPPLQLQGVPPDGEGLHSPAHTSSIPPRHCCGIGLGLGTVVGIPGDALSVSHLNATVKTGMRKQGCPENVDLHRECEK